MIKLIKNGKVLNPYGNGFNAKDVYIDGGKFIEYSERADEIINAEGLYLLPGMIDIHTHGANGVSFTDKKDFSPARKWFAEQGVTAFLPTITTLPVDKLVEIEKNIVDVTKRKKGEASIIGIHLEGPFISNVKRGAMVLCDDKCNIEIYISCLMRGKETSKL